jgi:hypothetical protein
MRQKFLMLSLVVLVQISGAQSNTILDAFLEAESASFELSVYLVLVAAGDVEETASPAEALQRYAETGRRPLTRKLAADPVTAGEFGHLLMQALSISGGLMYSLFPGPWYAAKELSHKRLLPEVRLARQILTPFEVVYALQKALELGKAVEQ